MSPMPRKEGAAVHTISLRLSAELLDALEQTAESRMLGRSKLIELLLMDGLSRLPSVDVPLPRAMCSNCDLPIDEHCDVHTIPCCPGRCSVSPTDGVVELAQ